MMPSPDIFPVPLIHISETNSTNNYLQSLCSKQKVEELTVVVADFQTSGRGQRGNSWESDSGKNLLFSIVIFLNSWKHDASFSFHRLFLWLLRKNWIPIPPISLSNGRTIFIGKKENMWNVDRKRSDGTEHQSKYSRDWNQY